MTAPPQMMRSIHIEQDMQYTCIRSLSCTSCGLGCEPAEHSQASRGQQRPGRTISLLPPSYLSHDIYACCWCKPQRPGRHHLVFLGSIVLCSALA